jgi:hypothetical protein
MLTLFTVAKPFCGEFARIQRNAILSWTHLRPACEILLLGDDAGVREVAADAGATHVPELERNEFGTPLLSNVFSEAERRTSFPILCYVNADIILLEDFLPAVQRIIAWNSGSLIVGRRWDLDFTEFLTWEPHWERRFRARVLKSALLHAHSGLDYFVFPRGFWGTVPPFAIGRSLWDEWLLYRARGLRAPVVDATECITAVHQNHSYSHHPEGQAGVSEGPEAQRNMEIGGGLRHAYTLYDATHRLTPSGIKRRLVPFDLRRRWVVPIITHKWVRPLVRLKKAVVNAPAHSRRHNEAR